MSLIADVFPEVPIPKNMLDKCLKGHVSEDHYTGKTANESKIFITLNDSTFTVIINHCGGSCIGKSLF